jgi:hypothetical protein
MKVQSAWQKGQPPVPQYMMLGQINFILLVRQAAFAKSKVKFAGWFNIPDLLVSCFHEATKHMILTHLFLPTGVPLFKPRDLTLRVLKYKVTDLNP